MAEDIARPFNSGQERDPHLQSPLCGGRAYCPALDMASAGGDPPAGYLRAGDGRPWTASGRR